MTVGEQFELWLELNTPRAEQRVRARLFRLAIVEPSPELHSRARRLLARICIFPFFLLHLVLTAVRYAFGGTATQEPLLPVTRDPIPAEQAVHFGLEPNEPRAGPTEARPVIESIATPKAEGGNVALRLREKEIVRLDLEESQVGVQEKVCFWLLIVAAICALAFVVLGGLLITNDKTTVGVVVEVVGLLPAAGTAILWKLLRHTSARRQSFANERERNLQEIQKLTSNS
jgi:hypothetical protein